MSQKSESNNPLAFTDDELKEKEEELLRLIKKTIIEFKESWKKKNEGNHSYYSRYCSLSQDYGSSGGAASR